MRAQAYPRSHRHKYLTRDSARYVVFYGKRGSGRVVSSFRTIDEAIIYAMQHWHMQPDCIWDTKKKCYVHRFEYNDDSYTA